jgi:hypothetical protein
MPTKFCKKVNLLHNAQKMVFWGIFLAA